MIESLDEVLSGQRLNLFGDVDIQLVMHADGVPRLIAYQSGDMGHDPEQMVVLDAHQIAHLTRVLHAMIKHGGNLNADVATPGTGG